MIPKIIKNLIPCRAREHTHLSEQANSELRFLQQRYSELQQRYQILTENLAASVLIRDAGGQLAYASPYTLVLTGYSLEETSKNAGDFFATITHPEDQENYHNAIRVTQQGEPYQTRFRIIHKAGIEVWVEMRTAPIFGGNSEVEGVLAIVLDVTSQVRYQKQVEERTRDLHDLSYMISHDLRSPILTIKGMTNLLEQELKSISQLGPTAQETVLHISQAARRLEDLIGSVLNYFKLSAEESQKEKFEVLQLLRDVISDLKVASEQAAAEIEFTEESFLIQSDRLKCYRIFSNLISNAIKYRDSERQLKIIITCSMSPSGRDFSVRIQDNGLGIPAEKLTSIFRPFQRANTKQIEGFGVGLASVKKLVHSIGGNVEVESTLGHGSAFTVCLKNCSPQAL